MLANRVGDFAPPVNGLHFKNGFPRDPLLAVPLPGLPDVSVGDSANGLSGGMVFVVRDFFEARRRPPPDTLPPAPDSRLFRYLVDRQLDSLNLPRGPFRYYEWMSLPDEDSWVGPGTATRTVRDEWPRAKAVIDRGGLCPLGLVRVRSMEPRDLPRNHQALAYGYFSDERAARVSLVLYDPNRPDEEVALEFGTDPAKPGLLAYSTGESVRGFFTIAYGKRVPDAALGEALPVSAR